MSRRRPSGSWSHRPATTPGAKRPPLPPSSATGRQLPAKGPAGISTPPKGCPQNLEPPPPSSGGEPAGPDLLSKQELATAGSVCGPQRGTPGRQPSLQQHPHQHDGAAPRQPNSCELQRPLQPGRYTAGLLNPALGWSPKEHRHPAANDTQPEGAPAKGWAETWPNDHGAHGAGSW